MRCQNEHPVVKNLPYKLAIIGEAPSSDDENCGKPFTGTSGRFLSALLSTTNILRSGCFIGNVCQYRPPDDNLSNFSWEGDKIQEGLSCLKNDLEQFQPSLCLLLGKFALQAAGVTKALGDWRGTLFICNTLQSPFFGRKCLASFDPGYCLRDYSSTPILKLDLFRAREEAHFPDLRVPERQLLTELSFSEIVSKLESIILSKKTIAFDIEGGVHRGGITCYSLADSLSHSFVVPFSFGTESIWSEQEEMILWQLTAKILSDEKIPKILQNSLYDRFVMAYSHGITVRGVVDDTMLKHWEMYCEMEKGLGFLTSIYTKHPFYKDERKNPDKRSFWTYSATDSAVTYEINDVLTARLKGASLDHYRFNMQMLEVMLSMQLQGIAFDKNKCSRRVQELNNTVESQQELLNIMAGQDLNVNSPKQMKEFVYGKLKLPPVIKRATGKPTADYEALLKLAKKHNMPVLNHCLNVRSLRKRISLLNSLTTDPDGRIRCSYNIVGTDTGRISCYESVSGSGTNLQTIPKPDRDLFIADEGFHFFQCDLSGADGWTVAAHCAALGDPTMLEDYLFGIKPAKVLALMIKHGPTIATLNRNELKTRCKEINPETDSENNYIYFISKCCQHGTNYDMGPLLLAGTVFKESEGNITLSSRDADVYQSLYRKRYCGIRRWHTWVQERIQKDGYLDSASGNRRIFFGRKDSHDTHKLAYAHEPQANTTYATNRAAYNIFTSQSSIQLLHQVHDAVCGQFPTGLLVESREIIRRAFDFEMCVHGVTIKIPFEGGYGKSWYDCKEVL
jgi:uracil-DNA glycosylase family 4